MSRNQAVKQFGLAISTAVNWSKRNDKTGSVEPGQMGGHKPKAISGEYAVWLQRRIRESDFTLRGLGAELAELGLEVDYRSVWEFVHAEKLQKKAWWLVNATVLTQLGGAARGGSIKLMPKLGWSSSMRPGPEPTRRP